MPYNYKTELQRYRRYYQSLEPIVKKSTSRGYTAIIFSFLAVSLFGWYAIRPTIQTILYLRREIADKTEINKQMEEKIASLIEAQALYQEIEPLLPAVDQALPMQPDAIPVIVQLRNLASRSGILISSVQIPPVSLLGQTTQQAGKKTTPPPSKQATFDFTIAVQGTYPMVRSFLEGVASMRRVVAIDGITVTPYQLESVSTQSAVPVPSGKLLQLALKLRAFYLTQ
jgi:Tfp pilus assembly protein PilO